MTARDFVYWLQGHFELKGKAAPLEPMSVEQVEMIRNHLAMVFIHEIDPGMGRPEHQAALNDAHKLSSAELTKPQCVIPNKHPGNYRC